MLAIIIEKVVAIDFVLRKTFKPTYIGVIIGNNIPKNILYKRK